MKNASKVTTSFLLITVLLTSCNSFLPTRQTPPTQATETALVIVGTEMAETQAGIPTATSIVTPLPTYSPLSPTETPIPTSALSFSGTPTVVPLSNGLTWSECVVPIDDYARTDSDMEFLAKCIEFTTRNEDY
jgi:hypothetical protein